MESPSSSDEGHVFQLLVKPKVPTAKMEEKSDVFAREKGSQSHTISNLFPREKHVSMSPDTQTSHEVPQLSTAITTS